MITVKRNAPVFGRSYGHWWLEVDSVESYGWWPAKPPDLAGLLRGTAGVLNGPGDSAAAAPLRDPNHGLPADYEFHPILVMPRSDRRRAGRHLGVREQLPRRLALVHPADDELPSVPAGPDGCGRARRRDRQLSDARVGLSGARPPQASHRSLHREAALATEPSAS